MKAKINRDLISETKPQTTPLEIYDTDLKGFTLRIQPSGATSFIVRYRLPNGKQTRHTIGQYPVMSAAKARGEALKILSGLIDGTDPAKKVVAPKEYTLFSFIDEVYAPWAEAKVNQKDGKATVRRLKASLPEFHDKKLTEINAENIEKWRTNRSNSGKKATTINRDLTALKACLSKAVMWEHLQSNPLSGVKPAKVDNNSRVRFLSEQEEVSLMAAIDSRDQRIKAERTSGNEWRKVRKLSPMRDLTPLPFADHLKPMVLVSLNTGIRWGELVALTWDRIDFNNANLTIDGTTAKSTKTRHVPLNSIALSALKSWEEMSDGEIIFPGRDGNTLDNVNKAWGAVLTEAKIDKFRWHDQRHHFASKLVMAGVDLNTVRELLGHSDLKMTLRYAHLAPKHKADAVEKLVGNGPD